MNTNDPRSYLANLLNNGATRMLLDGPRAADNQVINQLSTREWKMETVGDCIVYSRHNPEIYIAFRQANG